MSKENTGLVRIYKAFLNSARGFKLAFKHEAAFRQELLLMLIMCPVIFIVEVSTIEKLIMGMSLIIVLIVELLNSGIEAAIDRIGPEFHELSGRAKDVASAAVFLSLAQVVIVWAVILW